MYQWESNGRKLVSNLDKNKWVGVVFTRKDGEKE